MVTDDPHLHFEIETTSDVVRSMLHKYCNIMTLYLVSNYTLLKGMSEKEL